jgi:uncharacterized membrane protein
VNRNWIEKEGKHWVKDGLIQKEQLEQILSRYPEKSSKSLLPIFASILVGLGILSFIASNWDIISNLGKLLIIIISMTVFYIIGNKKVAKGDSRLGHALIGLGVITFGAGIILISQIYNFTFYNASSFILWSFGALCMLALYRSKFLFYLSIIIITVGQIYSTNEYHTFSYILAIFLVFGIGHFVYHRAFRHFSLVFAISFIITAFDYLVNEDISYLWLSIGTLILLIIAEVPSRSLYFKPLLMTGFIFQILLVCFNIFTMDSLIRYESEQLPNTILYSSVLIVLCAVYLFINYRSDRFKMLYLIPLLPAFIMGSSADVMYILLLYVFAIAALVVGYQYQKTEYVNLGTLVFLISTFVAYIQLAWDFMPKSMFFLSGGILLFVLSWYLERRRRKWLKSNGGEPH